MKEIKLIRYQAEISVFVWTPECYTEEIDNSILSFFDEDDWKAIQHVRSICDCMEENYPFDVSIAYRLDAQDTPVSEWRNVR